MTNPVNLTDLLQAIGPGNLNFQQLDNCLESVKAKQGVAMVTFGTEAISPNDAATDDMPHGIIIWVDRDLYQQRFQALQRGEGQTYGQLQAQLNEALALLREAIGETPQTQSFPARCDAAMAGHRPGHTHHHLITRDPGDVLPAMGEPGRICLASEVGAATFIKHDPLPRIARTEVVITAPERIWLQVGDEEHYSSEPFPNNTSEVTWCMESVAGCEVPYIRADLFATPPLIYSQDDKQGGEA